MTATDLAEIFAIPPAKRICKCGRVATGPVPVNWSFAHKRWLCGFCFFAK